MFQSLVYKLLASCPDLAKLYLLMRPKKNITAEERLKQFLGRPIFEKVKSTDKVALVEGDINKPQLGLSLESIKELQSSVHLVFHLAAEVRFTIGLRDLLDFNVLGTLRLMELCQEFKSLEIVFAGFRTCLYRLLQHQPEGIEGRGVPIWDPCTEFPGFCQNVLTRLYDCGRWTSPEVLENIRPALLKQFKQPNNYTLSKFLGEQMVLERRGNLPTAIVRPSIVIGSWKEPIPVGRILFLTMYLVLCLLIALISSLVLYLIASTSIFCISRILPNTVLELQEAVW
ncbi:FAR2 [Cordylochernes scorpioides]|uniref:Fatty acyl-CoA reductase n=1 Tax=Cordylochernes scorpioides TaxID=51811 RepID=A0ABY6LBL1_9ARAC|nr:FAR2 [Cordylochernes scorpioides]